MFYPRFTYVNVNEEDPNEPVFFSQVITLCMIPDFGIFYKYKFIQNNKKIYNVKIRENNVSKHQLYQR